jgi:tricorn protease
VTGTYLRYPTVRGEQLAFVAENDVWLGSVDGGRAWRLTADRAPVAFAKLSPDGALVAYISRRDGAAEVWVVPTDGGSARRLTYWGDDRARVIGWTPDGRVLAVSTAGQPFWSRTIAYAVPLDGGPAERLPWGPVTAVSYGPGGTLLGVNQSPRSAASWKRYRGGEAGKIWIDRGDTGTFTRLLGEMTAQLEDPAWVGDRVAFLSDHEGWGNLYSVTPEGGDLRRHTDHGTGYARAAGTDGSRVVYQHQGDLWLVSSLDPGAEPRQLDVLLAGPRTARAEWSLDPRDGLGDYAPDRTGRASAVEVRGTVHWLTHADGPVRALSVAPGVRGRLPQVLAGEDGARAAWVTDAAGDDAIEIAPVDGGEAVRYAGGALGRVQELAAAPDGRSLAVSTHDGRVLLVSAADGSVREVDRSGYGDARGLAYSPDSRWLAWSHAGPPPLRQIRLANLAALPGGLPGGDGTEPTAEAIATAAQSLAEAAGAAAGTAGEPGAEPGREPAAAAVAAAAAEIAGTAGPTSEAAGEPGTDPAAEAIAAVAAEIAEASGRVPAAEPAAEAVAAEVAGSTDPATEGGSASGDSGEDADGGEPAVGAAGPGAAGPGGGEDEGETGPVVVDATPLRFTDTEPVFTLDGKHLAFLSARTFDPVYDEHVFDLSFPAAIRPYLLPLAATTPSPFDPEREGRPAPASDDGDSGDGDATRRVTVDVAGLHHRAVPLPVPAGRYTGLLAARDGLLWLQQPLVGVLGDGQADDDAGRAKLLRYDLRKRRQVTLADAVDTVAVTGDGRWVVLRDGSSLRLAPADRRVDPSDDSAAESTVDINLDRVRVRVDPTAEWRQMFDEAGRLMRDHFWVADMGGVDWAGVLARYRPLVDRIGSRDDLSELFWEVQGELGSSHAYETPPGTYVGPARRLGFLGADLERDTDGRWRVARVVPGEPSAPAARSPLLAPGVAMRDGDVILAVDGRPVDPVAGPAALLVGAAGVPVELTVSRGEEVFTAVVEPLPDERSLRYHDWVAGRRAAVHAATDGRVGYLHVPDMTGNGWAQLHRDLHLEVSREALVVDVRDNGGGHVSELVIEKLSRTIEGWDTIRHTGPVSYPSNSPRGPLVAVCNEFAGSDGDIVMAVFSQRGLGPIIGTRTWGGVIGIDGRYRLVDGTSVTQPRYSFWFVDAGWTVENHGVDPDIEVPIPPQSWAAGEDPQLDTAIRLALEALTEHPAAQPPDPTTRPSRVPPSLPPRT